MTTLFQRKFVFIFLDDWNGNWFPAPPGQIITNQSITAVSKKLENKNQFPVMGNADYNCDNGMV